jgi:hypothetical protein
VERVITVAATRHDIVILMLFVRKKIKSYFSVKVYKTSFANVFFQHWVIDLYLQYNDG